jgi:hypothetical protein
MAKQLSFSQPPPEKFLIFLRDFVNLLKSGTAEGGISPPVLVQGFEGSFSVNT